MEVDTVSYDSDLYDKEITGLDVEGLWIEERECSDGSYDRWIIPNVSREECESVCSMLLQDGFADLREYGNIMYYED